jgi:hypothetical protein
MLASHFFFNEQVHGTPSFEFAMNAEQLQPIILKNVASSILGETKERDLTQKGMMHSALKLVKSQRFTLQLFFFVTRDISVSPKKKSSGRGCPRMRCRLSAIASLYSTQRDRESNVSDIANHQTQTHKRNRKQKNKAKSSQPHCTPVNGSSN